MSKISRVRMGILYLVRNTELGNLQELRANSILRWDIKRLILIPVHSDLCPSSVADEWIHGIKPKQDMPCMKTYHWRLLSFGKEIKFFSGILYFYFDTILRVSLCWRKGGGRGKQEGVRRENRDGKGNSNKEGLLALGCAHADWGYSFWTGCVFNHLKTSPESSVSSSWP